MRDPKPKYTIPRIVFPENGVCPFLSLAECKRHGRIAKFICAADGGGREINMEDRQKKQEKKVYIPAEISVILLCGADMMTLSDQGEWYIFE